MPKKAAKQPPHLRLRVDPKLLARLEKAREANGNTLTGEIASRLEESFNTADKIALYKEAADKLSNELRREQNELLKQIEAIESDHQKDLARWAQLEGANALLNGLLGENKLKAQALRLFAIAIAKIPDNEFVAAAVFGTGVINEHLTAELKALAARNP
jgi:hypothetical protein